MDKNPIITLASELYIVVVAEKANRIKIGFICCSILHFADERSDMNL